MRPSTTFVSFGSNSGTTSALPRIEGTTSGIEGKPLLALPAAERARVKDEHLEELRQLTTEKGIWVDVPLIVGIGMKPLS